MSRKAKICFLAAGLVLMATFAIQVMTGAWLNLNTILMASAVGLVILAVGLDFKLYWEFLTMRTTKHGMNMGLLILLSVVFLVCINYLANKHNKTWDLTAEKANSLSEQSTKLLKGLKTDLTLKVFYRGPSANEERQKIKQNVTLYQENSSHLKVQFINSYVDQQEAIQYLSDQPDRDHAPVVAFMEYNGKKVRVDEPYDEAALTAAMIKATREGETKVYVVKGHGERDLESEDDQGVKEFVKALRESSYVVEPLNLIDKKEVPADAAVVAILGPTVPYLDSEITWLRDYLNRGGHIFVALDPGQRQNLANLTKPLGVEFQNNYVITMAPIVGGGPATILGRTFDPASEITKSLPSGATFSVFPLASEVKVAPDKAEGLDVREIVKSDGFAFTVNDISQPIRSKPETKAVSIAVESKGKLTPEAKDFSAVIFGDSDFLSNRALLLGANRDLALNAMAQLANQKDLISIRPKVPAGTVVTMTSIARWGVILAGIGLPLILLITSGVLWFRRRGA